MVLLSIFNELLVWVTFTILLPATITFANPQGGQVVSGTANISTTSANVLQVQQTSPKAIINWQSYNIQSNEQVNYHQPNSSSITLNRINPQNGVSKIYGTITANGHVWLVNSAGIHFGPNAYINVGGLLATTAGISDEDFLAGRYRFYNSPDWHGAIINEGYIKTSEAGLVALIGSGVVNHGLIEAQLGTVILAAGSEFTVNFSGNDLISFVVDKEVIDPAQTEDGKRLLDGVTNDGTVTADGGKVLITAHTASDILDHTINMKGVIQVNTVSEKQGVIILDGGSGIVKVTGKIIAKGKDTNEKGGMVTIIGNAIMLTEFAEIDISGMNGGGTLLIGGQAHGAVPEMNANYTYMGSDTKIIADAIQFGDGGSVVLWSNLVTQFYGTISAQGGSEGGNGGWVETSGKENLLSFGSVVASSLLGEAGTWLLDPFNVTITTATANGTFSGGDPDIFTPTGSSATINVATINASLDAGTSVTITTGSSGSQAGNITLSSAILKSAGLTTPTLILNAAGSINVNNSIDATSGGLNVSFVAGSNTIVAANISTNGGTFSNSSNAFTVNASQTINTNGGDFTNTSSSLTLNGAVNSAGGNFNSITQNATTISGTLDAGSGTIAFAVNADGAGGNDFVMNVGSSITTTNNTINAINIAVNTAVGGAGTAVLRDITVGSNGTLTVTTDTGSNTTGGTITTPTGTLNIGSLIMSTPAAMTLTSSINASGSITLQANTDGIGGQDFTMAAGSSIATTDISSSAISILVNSAVGGTGTATLRNISTGDGGVITVRTDQGNNVTGGDITMPSGTLNVGTGTINLMVPNITGTNVGTSALPINMIAGEINITSGTGDTFIVNAGTGSLVLGSIISGDAFTLTSTSSTGITDNGILTIVGNMTLSAGSTQDITLNNANEIGTAIISSANNVTLNDINGISLGDSTISGFLNLTTQGDILQSGVLSIVNGTTTLSAGNSNNITLSNVNNNFLTVSITSANDVSLRDANVLDIGSSTIAGSLLLTASAAGGGITQSGSISVGQTITLVASAANDVVLDNVNNDFNVISITSVKDITLTDANSLEFGVSNVSGALSVSTNGAITQSGRVVVSGDTSLTAGSSNNIVMDITNNAFNTFSVISGNNVSVTDTNSLILGLMSVSGDLDVTAGGAITQNSSIQVAGITSLDSGNSNITLSSASNDFNIVKIVGANNTVLEDSNVIDLGLSTIGGTLSVTASNVSGGITQSDTTAAGKLDVSGATTLIAGTNNVSLQNPFNDFSTVAISSANNVDLQDVNDLNLGASNVAGDYSLLIGGTLTDSNTIVVSGINGLTATTVGGVTLNTASNQIGAFNINNSGGGNIILVTTIPLTVTGFSQSGGGTTSLTISGLLTISDGVTVNTSNATLTINATDLDLGTSGALDSGSVSTTITQNTAGGSIGLGDAIGTMTITGDELQRITATGLSIVAPTNGQINVDNISVADSANISTVTLTATAGTLGSIVFLNNPSYFKSLIANADNGITVSSDITTTVGNLSLDGDVGSGVGGNDAVTLNANLTAAGAMSLSATNGGVILAAPINLTSIGLTINDTLNGSYNLIVDAGSGTTVFAAPVGSLQAIGSGVGFAITMNSTGITTFADTLATNSGVTAQGAITFQNAVSLGDGDTGSVFNGLVTLTNVNGILMNNYDGISFNGGLSTTGGEMVVNSNNSQFNISSLTMGSDLVLISEGAQINITGVVSGTGRTLTLQEDSPASTGSIYFNGNITLGALITYAQPYSIAFYGSTNSITSATTFMNTSNTTFGSGTNTFNFANNLTITSTSFTGDNLTISAPNSVVTLNDLGLNTTGTFRIIARRLVGRIDVPQLQLSLTTGNFSGIVAGKSGVGAIKTFMLLTPVNPGKVFFDGIDIFNVLSGPIITAAMVFPTNYSSYTIEEVTSPPQNDPSFKVDGDCLSMGNNIVMCGNWNQ